MLSDEQVRSLIKKVQQGDEVARETLVEANLNLVRSMIQRFLGRGYDWDDLFQIGCIGLVKAIDRFDISYDVKFSTYAVPMILGEVKRFLRDDSPVKVSRPVKELAYRVYRLQEKLQIEMGREPTIQEIAKELSLPSAEVVSALEAVQMPTSLYEMTYYHNGDPIYLMDQIKQNEESPMFDKLALKQVLTKLPERERTIIFMRFFQDKTQSEIARLIGISQVQVSRLEKQALHHIRKHMIS